MDENRGGQIPVSSTICLGTALATVLSWDRSHSVLWAILHGALNWIYVLWYAVSQYG